MDATTTAFVGPVLSATADKNGNAIQFTIFVRTEYPGVSAAVPLNCTLTANVSTETGFEIASLIGDTTPLPFDSSVIARGQEVVVHGPFDAGKQPVGIAKRNLLMFDDRQ